MVSSGWRDAANSWYITEASFNYSRPLGGVRRINLVTKAVSDFILVGGLAVVQFSVTLVTRLSARANIVLIIFVAIVTIDRGSPLVALVC